MNKTCGTCTKCCEGWLTGNIKGHEMYPGKPCYFIEIGKGCTIYNDRPKDPCKDFSCGWLDIDSMPDEFKPENSGVIMYHKFILDHFYWSIVPAPNKPSPELLTWAIIYALSNNQNIVWLIGEKYYWIGSQEFSQIMSAIHSE